MLELASAFQANVGEMRDWYDGFNIGGVKLYNIFSVSRYLASRRLDTYWGNSGTMDLVAKAINGSRLSTLTMVASGEKITVPLAHLSSLKQLNDDAAFYSLLVQAGYLAIIGGAPTRAQVCIPNQEMMQIWRSFIFSAVVPENKMSVEKLFTGQDPVGFSAGLEQLMTDALSFWGLKGNIEQVYHVFLLGGLIFSDPLLDKSKSKSNRESGDGRYDVWVERNGKNYIFELKMCKAATTLEEMAQKALSQIDEKRYGADLDSSKPTWKVGIACFDKQCKVVCNVDGGSKVATMDSF
jgi:hypothetical protein